VRWTRRGEDAEPGCGDAAYCRIDIRAEVLFSHSIEREEGDEEEEDCVE
jgi:hypothetical protein